MVACRSGMTLVSIDEVMLRSLWLVIGWVTAYEYHSRPGVLGMAMPWLLQA